MKKFLIVISLFHSINSFSQRVEFSQIFRRNGSGYLMDFLCKEGCFGLGDFDTTRRINQLAFFEVSTNGFQRFLGSGNYFNIAPQILSMDNNHVYIRSSELLQSTNWVLQYGRTSVAKLQRGTNRLLWERYTMGSGLGYFGSNEVDALQADPAFVTSVGTRNNYPFIGAAEHPFIQEFDSSGNLLWEEDFLNWPNIHSFAGGAFKYPDDGVFISQKQRVPTVIQPIGSDSVKMFGIWYDKPTRTIFKRKFLPRYLQYDSYGDYEITPIKGDKYLINIKFQNVAWSPDLIQTYLTDSSLSLQSAFWVKNNYQIDQAIAL